MILHIVAILSRPVNWQASTAVDTSGIVKRAEEKMECLYNDIRRSGGGGGGGAPLGDVASIDKMNVLFDIVDRQA